MAGDIMLWTCTETKFVLFILLQYLIVLAKHAKQSNHTKHEEEHTDYPIGLCP
jgi:hypothetical protein